MICYRSSRAKCFFLLILCLIKVEKNISADINCNDQFAFHCESGDQCIDSEEQCDGKKDCNDGSDETVENCIAYRSNCPNVSFKCIYGGCITEDLACNGKPDCADGSDEALELCKPNEFETKIRGSCGSFEMQCKSGECIRYDDACDGTPDCKDGSDETSETCGGKTCRPPSFQCGYGACVAETAKCNSIKECVDGSDETAKLCPDIKRVSETTSIRPTLATFFTPAITTTSTERTFRPSSSTGCVVSYSAMYIIIRHAIRDNILTNGDMIPVSGAVNIECPQGYALKGYNQTRCTRGGLWSNSFPKCLKLCTETHPKSGFSTTVRFQYGGTDVTTNTKFEPTTKATVFCAQGYSEPEIFPTSLTCTDYGEWYPYKMRCQMECGKPSVPIQEYSQGGMPVNVTDVPWHVGIYNQSEKGYTNICGGTIISPRLVVSAAHCFFNTSNVMKGIMRDYSTFKIAAGKFYREYDSNKEPIPWLVQQRDIEDVWIDQHYNGRDSGFYRDISLIKLTEFLIFSDMVRPICLHFPQENYQSITSGIDGYFASFSELNIRQGESTLQKLRMQTVSHKDCENVLKDTPGVAYSTLAGDKFCLAAYKDNYACRGDSGNGFTVLNDKDNRHYLYGVISYSPLTTQDCNVHTMLVMTNALFYKSPLKTSRDDDVEKHDVVYQ